VSFQRESRYKNTKLFSRTGLTGASFSGTRVRQVNTAEGVLEHTIQAGERLDLLALHYYNDDRKWWRILDANPYLIDAGEVVLDAYEGETIVIPRAQD
jgi:nucleoid-associated protein YgaU